MSSRTSFTILCECFPQIDERIIKAVILEHGDDIESAVEFILNEAIPKQSANVVTEKFDHGCGSVDNLQSEPQFWVDSKQQAHDDDTPELFDEIILAGKNPIKFDGDVDICPLSVNLLTDGKAYNEIKVNSPSRSETAHLKFFGETCNGDYGISDESNISQSGAEIDNMQLTGMQSSVKNFADIEDLGFCNFSFKEETDEMSSKGMSYGVSSICGSEASIGQLRDITNDSSHEGENESMREMLFGGIKSISLLPAYNETIRCLDAEPIISLDASDFAEKRFMNNLPISRSIGDNIDYLSVYNKEVSLYTELDTRDSFSSAQSSIPSCNGSSSSCQIVDTQSLEGVVSEAKKNKEVLMEGMELIRSLWTKTHCEEAAARHAKEEAAKGGLEILGKVEELRQTLARAKETNDMHAGEVYGERAILATEARELRFRIAQLAAEKDSALCMINEMCGALQARYDAARKERETALEEKMKKEETARKVLEMEESVLTKVAQESRDLELEAETNTKLREFLIDRGHSVDSLQGELSVLYQDVKVLKEQIDGGIAPIANGFSSIKLAGSPGYEDCKSFSGSDDIDASRSMPNSSHESRDAQIVCNSLHDSIENMKNPSPVASCEPLANYVPNTIELLADSLVDHAANGGERSIAEADMECHGESLQSLNYSGEARKEYSFEQLSDEDGWQMLETDSEGFKEAGSGSFPSLSFLGKTKSKQN